MINIHFHAKTESRKTVILRLKNCDTLNPGNKVNAVRQNTICKVNDPYLLLGGAQPVIPPNLYTLFYMFMNIIAWGPQIKTILTVNVNVSSFYSAPLNNAT